MSRGVEVEFRFRPHQLEAWRSETRFEVRVWHRRAGKTFYTMARQLGRALETRRKDYQGFYLAPTRVQAKAIAWSYLKRWCLGLGVRPNESDLLIRLPNNATLQLLGAENYDALRGRYADDIAIDETALVPAEAWSKVLNPMLADRKGRATFIGTPNGRLNLFYELWQYAGESGDPEWSRKLLRHDQTNVLDAAEIRRMRQTMRPEEFAQELECSWDAAIRGAYYAREMSEAEADGRVVPVKWDKRFPVIGALDLGWSDAMVAIFAQEVASEVRILACETYEHTSIPDMVQHWRGLGWPIERLILPHDAKVPELGTGRTRLQVFNSLGVKTQLCGNLGVHEGIEQVRQMLPHCHFDTERTRMLREALVTYRSEYDEVRRVHRMTPIHDWSSHYADATRYLAIGRRGGSAQGRDRGPLQVRGSYA